MTDSFTSNKSRGDPEARSSHCPEGLAAYRADRDDFSRLLYLVYREIRAQKETNQKRPA